MRQPFRWHLLAGYLLLWPPWIVLLLRRSGDPDVLERWSWRLFGLLVAYLLVLLGATVVTCTRRPGGTIRDWILEWLVRVRRRPLLFGLCCAAPVLFVGVVLGGIRRLGVEPDAGLVVCLVSLVLLAGVCILALSLAGRPLEDQRQLHGKLALAGGAAVATIAVVEFAGAVLGLGAAAAWDINPRKLDVAFATNDFDVRVVTNSQGLREPADVPRRHRGTFRIVAIGDSMTFGWGVEWEEAYPHVAQRALRETYGRRDIEVINMGRPGAAPQDYLSLLQRYALQLDPDLIVIGFLVGNDCPVRPPARLRDSASAARELAALLAASRLSTSERWLQRSLFVRLAMAAFRAPSGRAPGAAGRVGPIFGEPNPLDLLQLEREIEALDDPEAAWARHAALRRDGWIEKGLQWRVNPWLIRSMLLHPGGPADSLALRDQTREMMEFEWQVCAGLLSEFKAVCDARRIPLVVLAIPSAHLVSDCWVEFLAARGCLIVDGMTTSRVVNDWLAESCRTLAIPHVDPLDEFRRQQRMGADLYFAADDHLNPRGQLLLGQALATALDPLLPAKQGPR